VIVDEKWIKDSWMDYMEKLVNEWDHRISSGVKEGAAGCIRIDEVAAALKKMRRHKAPGLSGLVAEMIQATEYIGTRWILDLYYGIVKEGCIPEDWKSSVVLPIYNAKEIHCSVDFMEELNFLEHAMKVVEIIFEHRIR